MLNTIDCQYDIVIVTIKIAMIKEEFKSHRFLAAITLQRISVKLQIFYRDRTHYHNKVIMSSWSMHLNKLYICLYRTAQHFDGRKH